MYSTRRTASLNSKPTHDNVALKRSISTTKYSLNVNPKKLSLEKLLDEIKYADSGKEFTTKLLQTFYGNYQGDDKRILTHAVTTLSTDSGKTNLFSSLLEQQFTPKFQQALAIGYIKDQQAAAFIKGKFDFPKFQQWYENINKDYGINKNFSTDLTAINFQGITYINDNVTFQTTENTIPVKLHNLQLHDPNLYKSQLATLSDYQLQKIIDHPLVNNFTLADIERIKLSNTKSTIYQNVRQKMGEQLNKEFNKKNYNKHIMAILSDCFNNRLEKLYPTHEEHEDNNEFSYDVTILTEIPSQELLVLYSNHLKHVDFSRCTIEKFIGNEFDVLHKLEILNLSTSKILKIGTIKHDNLKKLLLCSNNIKEIGEISCKNLIFLNLDSNQLSTVNHLNCPNLIKLFLSHNKLNSYEVDAPNLEILDLSDNKLSKVAINAPNLTDLKLSINQIEKIQDILINDCDKLTNLDLRINKLTTLYGISKFTKLTMLKLSNNNLTRINAQCFENLKNLMTLTLCYNKIECIEGKFVNKTLENIALSNNKLTNNVLSCFGYLINLITLNLAGNQLTTLSPNTLNSKFINSVCLDGNHITLNTNKILDFLGIPIYKSVYQEIKNSNWLTIKDNIIELDQITFNSLLQQEYLQNTPPKQTYEEYFLALLLTNKLHDPEILVKLITRIFDGSINVADLGQDIKFFIPLSKETYIPLTSLISNNFDYFINDKGKINNLIKVFADELLIQPLQDESISTIMQHELYNKLVNSYLNNQKSPFEINNAITHARYGWLKMYLNDFIIKKFNNNLANRNINEKIKNITQEQQQTIIACLQNNDTYSKQVLKNYINEMKIILDEPELNSFVEYLDNIRNNWNSTQINFLKEFYNSIHNMVDLNAWCSALSPYINWQQASLERKERIFKEVIEFEDLLIKKNTLSSDEFQNLYSCYILNTLTYRTQDNLEKLLISPFLQKSVKQKLAIVLGYYEIMSQEEDSFKPPVFVVEEKTSKKNRLLVFPQLKYLNNKEKFTLDSLNILNTINDKVDTTSSQILTLNILDQLNLPLFLSRLLYDKVSIKTKFSEFIQECLNSLMQKLNVNLSPQNLECFNKITDQIVWNIGFNIYCDDDFKKNLKEAFNDKEFRNEVFANIAINYLSNDNDINSFIQNVESSDKIPSLELNEVLNKCIDYLNFSNILQTPISDIKNSVNYFFGVAFMYMSSVDCFGLDLDSFVWFRLLGAYYLAKSISSNSVWEANSQEYIKSKIHQALTDTEMCSGAITSELYGKSSDYQMEDISAEMSSILNTVIRPKNNAN